MGHAAALSHHDRRRAPPPPPKKGVQRLGPRLNRPRALKPSDWLEVFRRIGAGVRAAVLPIAGKEAGRVRLEVGAGGDRTLELDRAAEGVVFGELDDLFARGERFSVLSEESGMRHHGADYPLVLVDPVDGSLNAKQGVPVFGLMLAVLDGPAIDDAFAGLVLNLSNGDSWTAIRKQGAWRNGEPLEVIPRQEPGRIQILGLESTSRALELAAPLIKRANKIRILGSMALSLAHTAAGGFDAFCAPIPIRLFDTAASLLLLAEAGGVATDMNGSPVGSLRASLDSRTTLLCAPTRELHAEALKVLSGES